MTEILAASIRDVRSVGRAFEYGANICTLCHPLSLEKCIIILTLTRVLNYLRMTGNPYNYHTLDTIPKKVYTK